MQMGVTGYGRVQLANLSSRGQLGRGVSNSEAGIDVAHLVSDFVGGKSQRGLVPEDDGEIDGHPCLRVLVNVEFFNSFKFTLTAAARKQSRGRDELVYNTLPE